MQKVRSLLSLSTRPFSYRRTMRRCSFRANNYIYSIPNTSKLQGASLYAAMHARCNKSRDIMLECLLSVRARHNGRVNNFVAQSWRRLARQLIVRSGCTCIHACIHVCANDRLFRKKTSNNKLLFSLDAFGLMEIANSCVIEAYTENSRK